jgi:hypothetical protein
MNYIAHFIGKNKGAIGVLQNHRVAVEAPNEEAARLKLYETHDHILQCVFIRSDEGLDINTNH